MNFKTKKEKTFSVISWSFVILIEDEHMERVSEWIKGSVQCTNMDRSAYVPAGCWLSIYRQRSSESQPKFMPKCASERPTKSSSLLKRKLLQLDFIVKENNCPSRRARKRFSNGSCDSDKI